jgi:hypothetical protein
MRQYCPWSKKEFTALLSTFERFCQAATSNTLVQTDTGGINSAFVSVDLMETGPARVWATGHRSIQEHEEFCQLFRSIVPEIFDLGYPDWE